MSTAIVGLTGGIGSGKSTVAATFRTLDVPILDLDAVGQQLTEPGQEGQAALVREFGSGILLPDGSIDRKRLAAMCFGSEEATRRLNRIMHPLIWREAEAWLAGQTAPYVLIEASVLIESGGAGRMDVVIVVLADEDIRRRRVRDRGGRGAACFDDIVCRQCSDAERLRVADIVIHNNAGLRELRAEVEAIHARLTQRFLPAVDSTGPDV